MDESPSSNWRQMFERSKQDRLTGSTVPKQSADPPPAPEPSYDDGYDPERGNTRPLSPQEVADEAARALAPEAQAYRPWTTHRGVRPAMMLHLRRYDPRSGLWMGWQVSYPHLIAVEYVGDKLLSLDFSARHFVIEGIGLDQLAAQLQSATVQMVQEYAPDIWGKAQPGPTIKGIRCLAPAGPQAE
jgi:hypothetical protein